MDELEIIQHKQIDGLSMFFNTLEYRAPHIHPEWELILPIEGEMLVSSGRCVYRANPGSLFVFSSNQPHELEAAESPCTFLCVQISPSFFSRMLPDLEETYVDDPMIANSLSKAEILAIRQRLLELMSIYLKKPARYGLYCASGIGFLMYWILDNVPVHRISKAEAADQEKRNARLARLLSFVNENYMHKIRLSDFAQTEGLSVNYLSQLIREAFNQSFQEFVKTIRYNYACKLIITTEKKLLDICYDSGFSDYRYFVKTFRDKSGMTPEEYRGERHLLAVQDNKSSRNDNSLEHFYSTADSLKILQKYQPEIGKAGEVPLFQ